MVSELRTGAYSIFAVFATVLIAIACLPTLVLGRRAALAAVKFWARTMLAGLDLICGVRYRVENAGRVPNGPAIVAANHQSMWETIAFFAILPSPVFVFKKELLRVPVYGWWARRVGCIAVDRKAGAKAMRALTRAAADRLAEGAQIVVFPEGTRVRLGQRRRLQPGVAAIYAETGAEVVPFVHNSGRHWRHPGGLGAPKTPGVITVNIDAAIEPGLDRRALLAALAERFEALRDDLPRPASSPGAGVAKQAEGARA